MDKNILHVMHCTWYPGGGAVPASRLSVVTKGGSLAVAAVSWTPVRSLLRSQRWRGELCSPNRGLQAPHSEVLGSLGAAVSFGFYNYLMADRALGL